MHLFIVESSNKVPKIQSILGEGWKVTASVDHIRDLPEHEMGVEAIGSIRVWKSETGTTFSLDELDPAKVRIAALEREQKAQPEPEYHCYHSSSLPGSRSKPKHSRRAPACTTPLVQRHPSVSLPAILY
jgi:hypothetical protein